MCCSLSKWGVLGMVTIPWAWYNICHGSIFYVLCMFLNNNNNNNNLLFEAEHLYLECVLACTDAAQELTVGMLTEDARKCNGLLQWYSNCVSQNPGDPWAFSGAPHAYFLHHRTGTINCSNSYFTVLLSFLCIIVLGFFLYELPIIKFLFS